MSVLADTYWKEHPTIVEPFLSYKVRALFGKPVVSYGLSSCGYDLRLGRLFLIPRGKTSDPFSGVQYATIEAEETFVLPAHGMVLAHTYETITMPTDVVGYVFGKSTYARLGLLVNATPVEPGWSGSLTLALLNLSSSAITLFVRQGIAQLQLVQLHESTSTPYTGPYQHAKGPQVPSLAAVSEQPKPDQAVYVVNASDD